MWYNVACIERRFRLFNYVIMLPIIEKIYKCLISKVLGFFDIIIIGMAMMTTSPLFVRPVYFFILVHSDLIMPKLILPFQRRKVVVALIFESVLACELDMSCISLPYLSSWSMSTIIEFIITFHSLMTHDWSISHNTNCISM